MPEDPASPAPTPANYQRTTGGHLRWQPPSPEHLQGLLPAYEILGLIGKGGMGAVYKGRQKSLERLVAIKLLPPEAADNDMQFVERFKNEARTMARMNHPAIVHVYDFGETSDGQLYIVMEYIDGTDVAKMIQCQGRLPPEHALAITAHVCDALQYAHTHGVVHRDIKPANILLNMEGQVKVADFGLAKTNEAGQEGLTKTNMAMGTPDFVAPEALTPGMTVDGRADLYAVGVMLYNMLTGQVPRGAFHMPSVIHATDVRFDGIINKAMQMDRELRYQTSLDLRRDLDVILTTPLAKPGVRTISVKPRDLKQKPAAQAPGSSPQQQKPRMTGTAGAPVRSQQPPTGGAPARPAAQAARKTAPNAQTPAVAATKPSPKKSRAGMIYGIAAVVLIAAVASFMVLQGGKQPGTKPGAQSTPSGTSKPTSSSAPPKLLSGTFMLDVKDAKLAGGEGNFKREAFKDHFLVSGWFPGSNAQPQSILSWEEVQVAAGEYDVVFTAGSNNAREFDLQLNVGKGRLSVNKFRPDTASVNASKDFPVGRIKLSSTAGGVNLVCTKWSLAKPGMSSTFFLRRIRFSPVARSAPAPADSPPPAAPVLTFAGHRYQLISSQDSWTDAKDKAAAMGGHLATITSKEEDEFLSRSFQGRLAKDGDFFFIGGIASPTPDWTWVTGESFAYKPGLSFKGGVTRVLSLEKISSKLRWKVQEAARVGFLVEWDDDGPMPPAAPMLSFSGHRYQIVTDKLTWDDAKAKAESMGGHLATITTREENDWVKKNLGTQLKRTPADSNGDRFFIGATQRKPPDGPWEWVSGEPYSHQSWMGKFPNDHNNIIKVATLNSAGWDDVQQNHQALSFLVEWDDAGPAPVEVKKAAEPAAQDPPMPATVPPPPPAPAPTTEPAKPADPRLAQLEAGYQARYDTDAQKPFLAAVAALNQSYVTNGIARARAAAQAKGSLAEINALDAERTAIETGEGIPAEDAADTPESLKALRTTYRTVLAQHTARRDTAAAPLLQLYLGALDAYVTELTKAGKIDEARQVQALRDAKAQLSAPPPAEAAAVPSGTPTGKEFTNSLGMTFVPVKGTDLMFCIHETRRQDYAAYAAENPSVDGSWKKANRNGVAVGDKDDHPVVAVNWEEAHKFCEWLSMKEGRTYRLPTDEEWSMAVGIGHQENRRKDSTPESLRIGLKEEYPWGGDFPPKTKDKVGNYKDAAYVEAFKGRPLLEDFDDGFATTAPVMSFKPNKLGIYDLGGNAEEWVEDWYNPSQKERATRGMNWYAGSNGAQDMLSSFRGHLVPNDHNIIIGFRIVLEAPKKAP